MNPIFWWWYCLWSALTFFQIWDALIENDIQGVHVCNLYLFQLKSCINHHKIVNYQESLIQYKKKTCISIRGVNSKYCMFQIWSNSKKYCIYRQFNKRIQNRSNSMYLRSSVIRIITLNTIITSTVLFNSILSMWTYHNSWFR